MNSTNKWLLTDEEKDKFIATLTPNLTILRTSAEISQEELANRCVWLFGLFTRETQGSSC